MSLTYSIWRVQSWPMTNRNTLFEVDYKMYVLDLSGPSSLPVVFSKSNDIHLFFLLFWLFF